MILLLERVATATSLGACLLAHTRLAGCRDVCAWAIVSPERTEELEVMCLMCSPIGIWEREVTPGIFMRRNEDRS